MALLGILILLGGLALVAILAIAIGLLFRSGRSPDE